MSATTRRGERGRAEILAAGRELLLERGLDGLSLREVARRAEYAPSALYNHFKDKDELVIALAMGAVGTLAARLSAVAPGPAPERLRGLGQAYVGFAEDHPQEYRVIFDCLANPPHTWDEYVAVAHPFSLIVAACAQGLAEGTIVDRAGVGASGLAYALWALVDGHVHLRAKHLAAVTAPYPAMFDAGLDALLLGLTERDPQ